MPSRTETEAAPAQTGPVGIVCNPASGKDIRRLTARASVFDNQEKLAIVRRERVRRTLDWVRRRFGSEPLQLPEARS